MLKGSSRLIHQVILPINGHFNLFLSSVSFFLTYALYFYICLTKDEYLIRYHTERR